MGNLCKKSYEEDKEKHSKIILFGKNYIIIKTKNNYYKEQLAHKNQIPQRNQSKI